MTQLSEWLYRHCSWPALVAITIAYALFLQEIMAPQAAVMAAAAGAWGAPDGHFFYRPDELYAALDGWSAGARRAYRDFRLGQDPLWAMIYGAFLVTATSLALRKIAAPASSWRPLNLAGLLPASADLTENLLGIFIVGALPTHWPAVAGGMAVVTAFKWTTLAAAHLVLVAAILFALRRRWRPRRQAL